MKEIYFHIGFHKTGTTWLQNEVFLNTGYFNLLNNHIKPWDDILIDYLVTSNPNDFEPAKLFEIVNQRIKKDKINIISAERLSGHPYSGGYDSRFIAEKIYKTFPKAKIIIVTRDYKSLTISTFKQIVKQGYPGSFNNYVNNNNWFLPRPSKFYFKNDNTVKLYKDLFNPNDILVLNFNTFKDHKKKYLDLIAAFFGISLSLNKGQQNKIINKAYSNQRIRAMILLNKFRKTEYNQFPLIVLNKKVINIMSKIISPLFSKKKFKNGIN